LAIENDIDINVTPLSEDNQKLEIEYKENENPKTIKENLESGIIPEKLKGKVKA
jgi:hypothetical protein